MPKKYRSIVSFLIAALLTFSIAMLLLGGMHYPLEQQTDAFLQIGIIADLLEKGTYISYFGVYYYAICAGVISLLTSFGLVSGDAVVQVSIMLVNMSCFIAALMGLWRIGRLLGFKFQGSLLLVTLFATNPIIQGQFRYVRCENFIIPVAVWLVYMLLSIRYQKHKSNASIAIAALLLALAITQKITALVLLPSSLIILFYGAFPKRQLKPAFQFLVLSSVLTTTLWVLHYKHTGIPFYQSNAETYNYPGENFDNKPSIDVMLRVNPIDAWLNPLQHEQRDSLGNILLIDLFGDYRETRYNYSVREEPTPERIKHGAVARARFGLLLSFLFLGICVYAMLPRRSCLILKAKVANDTLLDKLCFRKISNLYRINPNYGYLACAIGHIAILVTASYFNTYNPEKFDVIKWEYVSWSLIFCLIPMVGITQRSKENTNIQVAKVLLVALCAGGLVQSVYL